MLAFGAWFGDLETRTDGQGVAAVVRLYGAGDVLVSEQVVTPGPTYLPQSNCGNSYTGCGNNTTRWIGFVADPATPIQRMVVIVGDDDAGGNATDEGIGFIGPSLDLGTAAISLVKSSAPLTDSNGDGILGAGDTVLYSFLVTNTGTSTASSIAIVDPEAAGLSCPGASIAAGTSTTCTGSHVLTQPEVDSGTVTNTAHATAAVYGGMVTSNPSTASTTIAPEVSLTITKVVDHATYATVGTVLAYDISVRNAGNVTLSHVTISESAPGVGTFTSTCATIDATLTPLTSTTCHATYTVTQANAVVTTLAPLDVVTCTMEYTVTQADIDAGSLTNTVSATALDPTATAISTPDATATSQASRIESLVLVASAAEPSYSAVGNVIHYSLTLTNQGNGTLDSPVVTATAPGAGPFSTDCAAVIGPIAPGGTVTCSSTYTITQPDLDAGVLLAVANGSATAVGGGKVTAPTASASTPANQTITLTLLAVVAETDYDAVGDVLHYTFTLRNDGNVSLTAASVATPAFGAGLFTTDCGTVTTPAPGAQVTCTASYVVTQADLDAGVVATLSTATALDPESNSRFSNYAPTTASALQTPSFSVGKIANPDSFGAVGDQLHYTLTLVNTGNVSLATTTIADAAPGDGAFVSTCATVTIPLSPGASRSCTATYTIVETDRARGFVTNAGSGSAVAVGGLIAVPLQTSTATVELQTLSFTGSILTPVAFLIAIIMMLLGGVLLQVMRFDVTATRWHASAR